MRSFTRKGFGRIYTVKTEDIKKVKDIIKEMDAFEFDYLPESLITEFKHYPELEYTHKFDTLDLDELTVRCFNIGIVVICIDNGRQEYMINS